MLHLAALDSKERAAIFLVCHGAQTDHTNQQGEAPMHIAAIQGLHNLVQVLLEYGADPNLQTNLKMEPPHMVALRNMDTPPLSRGSPLMTPTSTLGALTALSSIVSPRSADSNQSNQFDSLQELNQLTKNSPLIPHVIPPARLSNNPFGDSDDEDTKPSSYHLSPYSSPPRVESNPSTPSGQSPQVSHTHLSLLINVGVSFS